MFAGVHFTPMDVSFFPRGVHGDVRAKHDGEGIRRRPVAKPRPSRSQEFVPTAHGQNTDYSHFEQNKNG